MKGLIDQRMGLYENTKRGSPDEIYPPEFATINGVPYDAIKTPIDREDYQVHKPQFYDANQPSDKVDYQFNVQRKYDAGFKHNPEEMVGWVC